MYTQKMDPIICFVFLPNVSYHLFSLNLSFLPPPPFLTIFQTCQQCLNSLSSPPIHVENILKNIAHNIPRCLIWNLQISKIDCISHVTSHTAYLFSMQPLFNFHIMQGSFVSKAAVPGSKLEYDIPSWIMTRNHQIPNLISL